MGALGRAKLKMIYPAITLKPNEEKRIGGPAGHPWIFSNEIAEFSPDANTPVVEVGSSEGRFCALALYNPKSLIVGRVAARHQDAVIDAEFWRLRLEKAWNLRRRYYPQETVFRWVFGESDGLPGLIIDRYGDYLVVETLSKAMESLLPDIIEAINPPPPSTSLRAGCPPPQGGRELLCKGILHRRDNGLRKLEGLEIGEPQILAGEIPGGQVESAIDGIICFADLWQGQKTGFFLDQRDNRNFLARFAPGRRVLDLYSYTGAFGLVMAKAGAASVRCVDTSQKALDICRLQTEKNNMADNITALRADAEIYLKSASDKYDIVIIDPPNLAPSKKDTPAAKRKLERIAAWAMKRVEAGGLLAACCCSHHIGEDEFLDVLRSASRRCQTAFRIAAVRGQAKDHPVLLGMPESSYLKFVLLERI
ncbi:MAG: class I SAM-dependent rRNA methyltransferase [Elusimicrobia bacterium]|nr:class I SAM-dependent rRNA methyltransferase [Elusimicrobiota bacterium]